MCSASVVNCERYLSQNRRLYEEQLFLGMVEPRELSEKLEKEKDKLRQAERKRRALQRQKAYE